MKLSDDMNEDKNSGLPTIYAALGVSVFVLFLLGIVILSNSDLKKSKVAVSSETKKEAIEQDYNTSKQQEEVKSLSENQVTATEKSVEELVSGSTLTSDQLDFWDSYQTENMAGNQTNGNIQESGGLNQSNRESNPKNQGAISDNKASVNKTVSGSKTDQSSHANQTLIKKSNGEEEWITINSYLTKNKYDFSGLVFQNPVMKYFENSECISYMGVDVSKYQGFVDYNKLKKAGVQYVMIRLGARGYGGGQLTLDDYYKDNMKGATDAGLSKGVYFFSQAISEAEAVEEANMVIENLKEYTISYPVVFDMEKIENDTARTDGLTPDQRTKIAASFLKTVKAAGYKTAIYGNKEWLLKKINLSVLSEYDVWLSQAEDIPDYPYKFAMWQYTTEGMIDGIAGKADLNISFIDYDLK